MPVDLIRLRQVDSTQDFLERHPELGFCAVLADCQLAGRGQRGNRWESAPGAGLWLSAALPAPRRGPGPGAAAGHGRRGRGPGALGRVAGAEVAQRPGGLASGGRLVKLGGIIGQVKGDRVLLGVGVNLASAPVIPGRPIPPACLADLAPPSAAMPDAEALALEILAAWEDLDTQREPAFRWPGAGRCDPLGGGRRGLRRLAGGWAAGGAHGGGAGEPDGGRGEWAELI